MYGLTGGWLQLSVQSLAVKLKNLHYFRIIMFIYLQIHLKY